jgi:hypothetical protein
LDKDKPEDVDGGVFIQPDKKRTRIDMKEAAGNEPVIIPFGGMYATAKEASAVAEKEIGLWAPDLTLNIVDMYEWLYPTIIDPDAIPERHHTQNSGLAQEQNTVMTTRKKTLELNAEARAATAALGIRLPETNVNEEIVDMDHVQEPGMYLKGEVQQFDAEGNLITRRRHAAAPEEETKWVVADMHVDRLPMRACDVPTVPVVGSAVGAGAGAAAAPSDF